MTIDELYSYSGLAGVSAVNNTTGVQKVTSAEEQSSDTVGAVSESGTDAYISTITSQNTELRSENYNDILEQIRQAKETLAGVGTSGDSTSASGVSGAGGSGGDSSDNEEEETTTIVTINGQTYLQTTTVNEDGTTTVTRTLIGTSAERPEDGGNEEVLASAKNITI